MRIRSFFPPKLGPFGAKKGSGDPGDRPTPGCRLSHRLSSWTLPGGPPSCVRRCRGSVRLFSLSNGPILWVWCRMKSFVCLCCVLWYFSPYSASRCLQTKNHQNSWNWLELSPTTTFGDWMLRKDEGVDGSISDLRTVNNHGDGDHYNSKGHTIHKYNLIICLWCLFSCHTVLLCFSYERYIFIMIE